MSLLRSDLERSELFESLCGCKSISTSLEVNVHCSRSWGKSSNWFQLAGHKGSVIPYVGGSVLKRYSDCEASCLQELQTDKLGSYVPVYLGDVILDGQRYIQMRDLLFNLASPSVMDCKMGRRTYLEDEVCRGPDTNHIRGDLYLKMMEIDPLAPTADEHFVQGVTKLRYMQWRETTTSTADYGFRIEGMKKSGDEQVHQSFKQCRSWTQIKHLFTEFVCSDRMVVERYLSELMRLREVLPTSDFFQKHEVIGSSILFTHDSLGSVNVWMIDFGKTVALPPGICIDHRTAWSLGNHEDGYLVGVDNLITLFEELLRETNEQTLVYKHIV